MSRCNNNRAIAKGSSYKKIDKTYAQVDITLENDIDACAKINTRRFLETTSTNAKYSPTTIPDDSINICESFGCKNTGTLMIVGTGKKASGKFRTVSDATDYVAGVLYYYVYLPKADTYKITSTLSDLADEKQTNADTYEQTIVADHEGFYAITVDLSVAPTKTVGNGWTATEDGTVVNIEIEGTNEESIGTVGISSIAFFDEISDLQGNEVVKLMCLSGVEGDDTLDALEEDCIKATYDEDSVTIERTVTAKQASPNLMKLNPLIKESDQADGFYMYTVEKEVKAYPGNEEYGYVTIGDMFIEECGFVYASIANECNVYDALLERINNPNIMQLNERQYQVLNSKLNPTMSIVGSRILVNKALIGKTLVVSYPRIAEIEKHFVANKKGLNDRRVKMTYSRETDDGILEQFVYRNVLVTSFPNGLTSDDAEFEVAFKVLPDNNDNYYEVAIINKKANEL